MACAAASRSASSRPSRRHESRDVLLEDARGAAVRALLCGQVEGPLHEVCHGVPLGVAIAVERPAQLVEPFGEALLEEVSVEEAAQEARFPGGLLAAGDGDVAEARARSSSAMPSSLARGLGSHNTIWKCPSSYR